MTIGELKALLVQASQSSDLANDTPVTLVSMDDSSVHEIFSVSVIAVSGSRKVVLKTRRTK